MWWQFLLAGLAAYLIGSFPTGVVATRLVGAPDVRYVGSGHTGGTNTMRQAGPVVGALVVVVDALKGLLAWGAAFLLLRGHAAALPIAATLAVIGHCWPLYTRFHGGMGLATAGGLILILSPLTIAIVVPIWAILFLGIYRKKYSPRCVTIAIPLAVGLSIAFLPLAANLRWMLGLVALVLVVRHLPEWNRVT
ncbi:MAG: acyl-phosphate glycerol 3-phosphate acyltransferase [Caldilineae bacterium]|nr:MAG: acyl-phosphate glycerol 3-phosphate acyltransferase [Caldilineae bacterium]